MRKEKPDHMITLEKAAIGYGKELPLLEDIDVSADHGEMVALIGRNGTGKSTLLKSMTGILPLKSGTCILNGLPLSEYGLRQRARTVSFVSSQLSIVPSITVLELVTLGRMPHTGWVGRSAKRDQEMILKAMEEVNLCGYADRRLDQLSDGERQRAMIARALAQDTPLMLLDEPTAFLDIPNKFELTRLLSEFRDKGKSLIYATHDLEMALSVADRIWVIDHGRILQGAPEDLGISGLFDTLYHESGILFDQSERRFRFRLKPKGEIRLSGQKGTILTWTRNALNRLGFSHRDRTDLAEIEVVDSGSIHRWILRRDGKEHSFDTIYSLARFLTREN